MRRRRQTTGDSSRRDFIRQAACAAVGTSSLVSTVWDLRMINAAAAGTLPTRGGFGSAALGGADYKALVCLFLYGGNDTNNMIVPTSNPDYTNYANARTVIALPNVGSPGGLLPLSPVASDSRTFGIHPSCAGLQALFNQPSFATAPGLGKLAIVANVGTLVEPLANVTEYNNPSKKKPPQLFSHNDQQVQWQTSVPDQLSRTGWGGRCADLLYSLNGNATVSMSMSLAGINTFEVGNVVNQYSISTSGTIGLNSQIPAARVQALRDLLVMPHPNLYQDAFATITDRALTNNDIVTQALAGAQTINTPFPNTNLANQLKMIARLISARTSLNHNRQIFFASIGGYDTHGNQLVAHANLMAELSGAMKAFYDATVELGVDNNVTTFTTSDFGRTFPSNGGGSDHGWGNHQIVMGGSVIGGEIYGAFPTLAVGGPQDTGLGRWIPGVAVDEFSATLAKWFGVSGTDLNTVFPNLNRFASPDLGFMNNV